MTINFFNTSFYDKESAGYSDKRYNSVPKTFVQFFFQERLRHVISLVGAFSEDKKNLLLLEDGCADGIVAQKVHACFPDRFGRVIGTDISPGMVEEARKLNRNSKFSFFLKKDLPENSAADIFLAVGFVSPGIFDDEFSFIKKHIGKEGIVILSLVSGASIYARTKLQDREVTKDYWDFKKYRQFFKKDFEILVAVPYGLFIPKLWAFPRLARMLQPVFETIFRIFPGLFHETLYVLKYKG